MSALPMKLCEHCGKEFQPWKTASKYCGIACYREAVTLPPKTCETCGKPCSDGADVCRACYDASRGGPKTMSGSARAEFGCLITFENVAGERLTLHTTGPAKLSVPLVLDDALRRDPTYRMISYSTPDTIGTDITGGRADMIGVGDNTFQVALPEVKILGLISRMEMLHPRLMNRNGAKMEVGNR